MCKNEKEENEIKSDGVEIGDVIADARSKEMKLK